MDIDIDLAPETKIDKIFRKAVRASMVEDGVLKPHLVGIYLQDIPIDNLTGLAAIPYKNAEDFGYYKIDMLTVNILKHFDSKKEMRELQRKEPDWSLLEDEEVVDKLFHLGGHFDIVSQVEPKSIEQLADVMALIRPNKRSLLYKYLKNPKKVRGALYTKIDNTDMRKSHATAYAILIALQLHLIEQGRL